MLANDSVTVAVEVPIWLCEDDIAALEDKYRITILPREPLDPQHPAAGHQPRTRARILACAAIWKTLLTTICMTREVSSSCQPWKQLESHRHMDSQPLTPGIPLSRDAFRAYHS
jgi:hypothetical protein